MKYFLSLAYLLLFFSSQAQETLSLNGASSPNAKLSQVAWMQGYWTGEAFGGEVEEIWTPPLGDSMMCAFKMVKDGKVVFYEMVQIREENGTLILRLKHFHGDLKGWETKDERVEFPLVKIEDNAVYFDGFTIRKVSKDQMNMYVMIGDENKKEEVEFIYSRSDFN